MQLNPPLRQAAGRCTQASESAADNEVENGSYNMRPLQNSLILYFRDLVSVFFF